MNNFFKIGDIVRGSRGLGTVESGPFQLHAGGPAVYYVIYEINKLGISSLILGQLNNDIYTWWCAEYYLRYWRDCPEYFKNKNYERI
jgi:hypothetical protein